MLALLGCIDSSSPASDPLEKGTPAPEALAKRVAGAALSGGGPLPKHDLVFVGVGDHAPPLCTANVSDRAPEVLCVEAHAFPGPRDPLGERILVTEVDDGGLGDRHRLAWWVKDGRTHPLTPWASWIKSPRWSPDGSHIVFASPEDGVSALWRVPRSGGTPVLIDQTDLGDFEPDERADGRIVFGTSRDFDAEIYSLHDGEVQRITSHPGDDVHPIWSPDGETLAWLRTDDGVQSVWLRSDGVDRQLIPNGPEQVAFAWAPDSRALAISVSAQGTTTIRVVGVDGTELSRVEGPTGAVRPAWSPDGRWIAFESGSVGEPVVMLSHRSGRDVRPVGPGWLPRWR